MLANHLTLTNLSSLFQPCTHISSSQITCQTPYIDTMGSSEMEATYGVGLDNIRDYNRFSTVVQIVPDPNVTKGDRIEFRNTFDNTITIKVNHTMTYSYVHKDRHNDVILALQAIQSQIRQCIIALHYSLLRLYNISIS